MRMQAFDLRGFRGLGFVAVSLASLVLTLLAGKAIAHHSANMFDSDRTIEISGTIREFQWTNPHVWIQVTVENADGAAEEWSIEGGGPNSLSRRGWRPTTFKPGDAVAFKVHPMRNGAPAGLFVGARLTDGATLGRWESSQGSTGY
jgi:Family of unknown function (DUF6152)